MRLTGLLWMAVAAVLVVGGGCSKTDSARPRSSDQPAPRPAAIGEGGAAANVDSEGEFVRDVALMNMAEIELSRMALARATSSDVKSFAQRMIDDHGAAEAALKSVITGQRIDWPAQLDGKHRETADELAEKQGADFDRSYAEAMVEGHQNLTAMLESRLDVQSLADWKTAAAGRTQSKALPEPDAAMTDVQVRPGKSNSEIARKVNQWAADTYPVAQKHLDTARTLENATKKRSTTN